MQQLQKYKKTELGQIPEEWNIFRLEEVCSIRKNGYPESHLYIGLEHIGQGNNQLISKGDIRDFTSNKNTFLKGDVLYGKLRPLLNKVYLAEEDGYCSTDILPLISNDNLSNKILLWILTSERFVNYADANSSGTKMPRTNWNDMKNFLIPLGKIDEQQKIASILSNVDELIQKTDQIIEQTQRLKKGLMQRLLTRGIAHTKFKKTELGEIPEEWSIVNLIDLASIRYGLSQPPIADENGIPLIRATNIKNGKIIQDKNLIYVNYDSIPKSRGVFLKKGDIIVVRSGVYTGDIGLIDEKFEGAIAGYDLIVSPDKKINSIFLTDYLLSLRVQNYFSQLKSRVAQSHLNAQQLSDTKISLPPIAEQNKISLISVNCDKKLLNLYNCRRKIENLKKGLMQQLLTGKMRVKV